MVSFSIPSGETAVTCYRDYILSSNKLNRLMLNMLDDGYPVASAKLAEYHALLKRINDLLFEINALELTGEQRDFFLKKRVKLKALFDDEAREEFTDRVYLNHEDENRPDIEEAFSLELTAMRQPYSSLLEDFSGLQMTREQAEALRFSEQVSIRISRMERFLRSMAGRYGGIPVKDLQENWEWIRDREREMVCLVRKCEEMLVSLPAEAPLNRLFEMVHARLWFHYADFCEQCMVLIACRGWGSDADRILLEEMKAYGRQYADAVRCDVFAEEERDALLEEVRRSGKVVFPPGWMRHFS